MSAGPGGTPSRRAFIGLAGVAGAAAVAGCASSSHTHVATAVGPKPPAPIPAYGAHQAGVARPQPPQPHVLIAVFDLVAGTDLAASTLATIGRTIASLTGPGTDARQGLSAGDLTLTLGVGPRLVRSVNPQLPGAADLPAFSREKIEETARGGDLVIQACGSDPVLLPIALDAVVAATAGAIRLRWSQAASRGPYVQITSALAAPRNVLGFVDGIIVPGADLDSAPEVWLDGPSAVRGGSIMVVRRMELDLASFAARTVDEQDAVIGRRRDTSVPLSGGVAADAPDLGAKTPDGRYVVPLRAHIRRAHALQTGVPVMLRRSYATSAPAGALFICFQNDLHTFTATLTRMQAGDDLFELSTTTAAGAFLVLPGFTAAAPLGSTLFG